MKHLYHFDILEQSQISEARRIISAIAKVLDFTKHQIGILSIAINEAASNIIKHGKGGELLIRSVTYGNINGLELLALDRGKGITDIPKILKDGTSTKGTLGIGIGAIRRASTLFDIYSQPERGTALLFRLWSKPLPYPLAPRMLEIGVVSLPKPDEEVSGDNWFVEQWENRSLLACIDGLGHGLLAAEAAKLAKKVINNNKSESPAAIMEKIHQELKHSRGAVISIADFQFGEGKLHFCSIGNITARLITPVKVLSLISTPGTAGYLKPRIKESIYELPTPDSFYIFTMHSDGISEHWSINDYPGLISRHPSIVSGVIYRDFNKRIDDATIVSARIRKGNSREP